MGVHILWLAVFFNRGNSPFPFHFLVNSAGINSSPDSSYFVHNHADKYLCGKSAKIFFCHLLQARGIFVF